MPRMELPDRPQECDAARPDPGVTPLLTLPDPRSTTTLPESNALAVSVADLAGATNSADRATAQSALVNTIRSLLAVADATSVTEALRAPLPSASARALITAVDAAINGPSADEQGSVLARVFLLPIVLVSAGKSPAIVPGVVPDIAEITAVMKRAAALGAVETFGLGNAFGSLAGASAVSPAALHALVRRFGSAGDNDLLTPKPVSIESADETVHLRFLAGASVTPADLPSFLETAGQIGRWGMGLSQALAQQLANPGLSLLPLPRAPRPWFTALHEGRFAREELAFNLFASGAIRRIRAASGDPEALITARANGTIRIDLTSPFDTMLAHAHAWQLAPADDLAAVERSIRQLLEDCRVPRVDSDDRVLPPEDLPRPVSVTSLFH